MSLKSPNPVPVPKRPFQFDIVKEFLDLDDSKEKRSGKDIVMLKGECMSPRLQLQDKESPAAVLRRLITENGGRPNCKLVYVTRHGEAQHNIEAKKIGGAEYSAVCAHFAKDRDPALTKDGEREAQQAGHLLSTSKAAEYASPTAVYCSSLKRTLQTAVLSAAQYLPSDKPLVLFPRDGLREFMGPSQFHVSDGRGDMKQLKETLQKLCTTKEMTVKFEDNFSDQDDGFSTAETYVNVDARIERELSKIFDETADDPSGAVHIVSHNRAIQSTLRLLGYPADKENYRVFNFDNAATVAVLIRRTPRTEAQQEELQMKDRVLQNEERKQIDEAYYTDVNSGFNKIQDECLQEKTEKWLPCLRKLEAEVESRIEDRALEMRLNLLRRALAGQFKYGDFMLSEGRS